MKHTELQIDDLVKYNGVNVRIYSIRGPEPHRDERFNNKAFVTILKDGMIDVPVDEISPIPLTEENLSLIFDDKGVDDTGSVAYICKDHGAGHEYLMVSEYPDGYFLRIHRRFEKGQMKKFVKYVHEIQHACNECDIDAHLSAQGLIISTDENIDSINYW